MLKLIMIILLLGAVPLILGAPWAKAYKIRYTVAFAYGFGYFLELALFHILAFLFAYFHLRFHVLTIVYSVLLAGACTINVIKIRKQGPIIPREKIRTWEKLHWHEWIMLAGFLIAVGIQIYQGIVLDPTYMAADDAAYVTMANDALTADYMGTTDPYTGNAAALDLSRAIQTSLFFPAYLTALSGISVAVMEHTVQYVQLLMLAYTIYIYLSGELFEKRDNCLAFAAFVSVFYIFGYHSMYSLTFRLLGPNYQGKAILAVSLTPMVFGILIHILKEPYRWQNGLLLLILSLAAVSLTLWGTGTMLIIVTLPVLLSLIRKQRYWKHLLYIPWGVAAPAVFVAIYSFLSR